MPLFGPKEERTFRVKGMTCANCQRHVGEALRAVPGVAAANVDLVFHRARVAYDPARVDFAAMRQAVRAAGYDLDEPGPAA